MFSKITKACAAMCLFAAFVNVKSQQISVPELDPAEKHKYVADPFVFYKWPGFAKAEGLYGQMPWYPAFIIDKRKDDDESDEANDDEANEEIQEEEEEEDEEPEDDFGYYSKHHEEDSEEIYYKPYRKQKPVAVASVGFGPAVGKPTWYGVLNAKVNSRSELDLDDVDDQEETEEDIVDPRNEQIKYRSLAPTRIHRSHILLLQPQSEEYYQPRPYPYTAFY